MYIRYLRYLSVDIKFHIFAYKKTHILNFNLNIIDSFPMPSSEDSPQLQTQQLNVNSESPIPGL